MAFFWTSRPRLVQRTQVIPHQPPRIERVSALDMYLDGAFRCTSKNHSSWKKWLVRPATLDNDVEEMTGVMAQFHNPLLLAIDDILIWKDQEIRSTITPSIDNDRCDMTLPVFGITSLFLPIHRLIRHNLIFTTSIETIKSDCPGYWLHLYEKIKSRYWIGLFCLKS